MEMSWIEKFQNDIEGIFRLEDSLEFDEIVVLNFSHHFDLVQ